MDDFESRFYRKPREGGVYNEKWRVREGLVKMLSMEASLGVCTLRVVDKINSENRVRGCDSVITSVIVLSPV